MKSEIFQLEEITTKEAFCFIKLGKEQGQTAEEIYNDLHCIDELLWHQRSKSLLNSRRIDVRNNNKMIDNIITKYL